ncbi:MAG: hypothetical protein KDK69_05810, partial [Chlamydiia bacterium]|nr:hypothetical protein [Chlamydiia bacterium]
LIFFFISIVSTYAYSSITKVTEATANEVLTLAAGAISRIYSNYFKSWIFGCAQNPTFEVV